jgi:predicted aspartyl protease
MPKLEIISQNLQKDGPIIEINVLVPTTRELTLRAEGKDVPTHEPINAMIDTGSGNCAIREDIPSKLGLNPHDKVRVKTASSHQSELRDVYFLRIVIPEQGITYEGDFTAMKLKDQKVQCLFGRDFLKNGVLIYDGPKNQCTVTLN